MLRYAITCRTLHPGNETARRHALIAQAHRLATEGIDYIQLREKDLPDLDRIELAQAMHAAIQSTGSHTRLLLNGSPQLALQAAVDGVHLPSSMLHTTREACGHLVISAACHTLQDVQHAITFADLILYAPIFEKRVAGSVIAGGLGLQALQIACIHAGTTPVLALGGVTASNAAACMSAGAAGIAAIRMFL